MLLRCVTVHYIQALNNQKSILPNVFRRIRRYASIITINHSLLWSPDTTVTAHDPMQNLGQTWIFYELGQTHLTQTKSNSDDPDDLPQFQYLKSMELL